MIGIYLITNLINQKVYIGQSVDIHRRYAEHLRSGQPEKYAIKNERDINTPIHKAMQKYGIDNFSLTILEECNKEELNEKEKHWIKKYQSNNKEKGYNLTKGGQESIGLSGENHSQAKLTQNEVNEIKKLLRETNKTMTEIMQIYKVSKSTICLINTGKTWKDDNETYPLRKTYTGLQGSKNPKSKYTEDQVMEMRKKYASGVSKKEIIQEYENIASAQSVRNILEGRTYKHLPFWSIKEQKWVEIK